MKARIPPKHRYTKTVVKGANELVERQQLESMRRFFKLMCIALNEEFGFGARRLARLIVAFNELLDKSKKDTIFWYHVDGRLKQMKMDFEEEPPEIQLGEDFI